MIFKSIKSETLRLVLFLISKDDTRLINSEYKNIDLDLTIYSKLDI